MTGLPPELEERVYEIWLDGDESERAAAFESVCAAHPEHAEALQLLHARLSAGDDVLGKVVTGMEHVPPERIGDYEILEEVGAGGFGVVYRAKQREPVERIVAIKVLLAERLHGASLIRFENERQALALMDHPAIARVLDAGATDEGQPYFVMDFVEGVSITEFCDRHKLGIPARLDLFRRVCAAVQHAHQKGVVHRDLKPSNVLVYEQDGRPVPKVIDFGIAKALTDGAVRHSFTTLEGGLVGTPEYMSPEQAASKPVDTRTDVYALGVLLYELLTGDLPFGRERLKAEGLVEVARIVCDEEPRRPSSSTDTWTSAESSAIAANRDTTPQRLARTLGPDLDWVVLKALQKEPAARYESAATLAADVGRFQRHLPVEARQPVFVYVARKFTKRHRVGVAVATSMFSLGALGVGGLTWTFFEIDESRRKLVEEAASLMRLSALQDHDDLIMKGEKLWPAVPEHIDDYRQWVEEAQGLVANKQLHVVKRDELRSLALQRPPEEREADRASHPDLARLDALDAEIASKRAAFVRRHRGIPGPDLPSVDWRFLPSDANKLSLRAWAFVKPTDRGTFGQEAEGLVMARRALELAEAEQEDVLVAAVGNVVAWAYFALGWDDEALDASRTALAIAPEEKREEFGGHLARLKGWVDKARSAEGLRAAEEELEGLETKRAKLELRVSERRSWSFPDTEAGREARWWHANLTKLIEALDALEDPKAGLLAEAEDAVSLERGWSMPRRLALAERLRHGFAAGGEFDADWRDAIQSIREHPDYGGLELARQAGLVPIGPDPDSGLWEFWHVASGDEPLRGDDGVLSMAEESGLVLVLLPGGTFQMGAQSEDRKQPNYDREAGADEAPVHELTLSPYLLSKYEMTQGQWKRLAGHNPSWYGPDGVWGAELRHEASLLQPVEQVSWDDCLHELERTGLSLPTERQWEYGARAGTDSPWWTGPDKRNLEGVANLEHDTGELLDDGYVVHGPVDAGPANGFGLHNVHGNVQEWTLRSYYRYPSRPQSDPVVRYGNHVQRGGSYLSVAADARSAVRVANAPSWATHYLGVRPAARIEP